MSLNASRITTRITTLDSATDRYDHEIALIDSTAAANQDDQPRSSSPSPSWRALARNPTKSSVRDHLARRKYARYQEGRYGSKPDSIASAEDNGLENTADQLRRAKPIPASEDTRVADFAHTPNGEDRGRRSADKKKSGKPHPERASEIDVLYENQRGSFFCGIPLYSHSSLMPFDPSSWQTKDFKDSPVNITNAQVPDPSWEWAWKSWYVDMSHDVDEEGWQYSFAFGASWVWHGSHPWFHSFVRRRRWLRKRVKRDHPTAAGESGTLGGAHRLTGDYFTIHSKRDRSPKSLTEGPKTARPDSYISHQSALDLEEPPDEIRDIATLLKALRSATIDREKIDLVKKFVDQGGEELVYLKEQISAIMSFLVFQNSRRQLLIYLKETANEAREHRKQHEAEQTPEGEDEERKINNLLAAVDAANAEIGGLEFWSDRKHVLKTVDDNSDITQTIATIFDQPAPKPDPERDLVQEIKGIPEDAELKKSTTAKYLSAKKQVQQIDTSQAEDKGKAKVARYDSEDDGITSDSTPRFGPDEILTPEQD